MQLVDYTHPLRVPSLRLPLDRRSADYYLRLYELSVQHPYASPYWKVYRNRVVMDGGSAWLQATYIADDLERVMAERGLLEELRPVVGSDDLEFDTALAQSLVLLGYHPKLADVHPVPV